MSCAGAAVSDAQTALRNRLFADVDEEEDVPENKKEVLGTVQQLLERTILQGEGNSLLIIGPRGSGKTWVRVPPLSVEEIMQRSMQVVNKVFHALQRDKRCRGNYIKVYLNGMVHTNDRLALLEIARQFNTDSNAGENMSFSAALDYLLCALRSGSHTNQSVIFLLDEFDQFAHHKNQSLLYNLLDISQSPQNPVALVGLTCRLDVVELLEKRVKSRFSHRQLLLFPHAGFGDYVALARSLLSLPLDFAHRQFRQRWEESIEKLMEDPAVLKTFQRQFRISADVRSLKILLLLPVCQLGCTHPHLSPSDFSLSLDLLHGDSLGAVMKGLSVLELCLLVAVRQLSELSSGEPFNFEMVYSEYKTFAQRAQSMEVFSHSVALKAFDHLLALELLVPVAEMSARHGAQQPREYSQVQLVLAPDLICRAVQQYPNCPTDLLRWATSQPVA